MTRGVLLYAHNSKEIDYSKLAIICSRLAFDNLQLPVSVVVDEDTLTYVEQSEHGKLFFDSFDKIITVDYKDANNYRMLYDGTEGKVVPFRNNNRYTAYELSPYEKTLVVDCDFLILSDNLKKYFDCNEELIFTKSPLDLKGRMHNDDIYISSTGPELLWATTFFFAKGKVAKIFFDTVQYVKENWNVLSQVYGYNVKTFRNDIAFSIARHIMYDFKKTNLITLDRFIMMQDKDILIEVNNDQLIFLLYDTKTEKYNVVSIKDSNVHVMNKHNLIRNFESFCV